jgi:hypothetical protein
MFAEQDISYSERVYCGDQHDCGCDIFDQLDKGAVFTGGYIDYHLYCGVEHFRHEDERAGDAERYKLNAAQLEVDAHQKSGDAAQENDAHVPVIQKKVRNAFESDAEAFEETVESEYAAKNPEWSGHSLSRLSYGFNMK